MIVDLSFRIVGKTVPLDHGYALYSAITRLLPAARWLGVNNIVLQFVRCILSGMEVVPNALRQSLNPITATNSIAI